VLFRSALLISSPLRDYSGNPKPLRDPDIPAQEIVEDLQAALEQFCEIAADLGADVLVEKDVHFVLIAPKRGLTKILRRRAS
jgi:hypothetical protein